jgi:ribosomal protein L5
MPVIVKAKKSVAGFKLRKGSDLLILVTIRNKVYLKSLTDSIIFTFMEDNMKGIENNGNIFFGLSKTYNKLGGAGINLQLFVKGQVKGNRGQYYKSQILIP